MGQCGARYTGKLTDLQRFTRGSITLAVDGLTRTAADIDLSDATSYSEVAQRVQEALGKAKTQPTAGKLIGGRVTASMAQLQTVKGGKLTLTVDSASKPLQDLDFSKAATLADVAKVISTALAGSATVQADMDTLTITSATTGARSSVGYATDPAPTGDVADLAVGLGLTEVAGGKVVAGTDAQSLPAPVVTYSSLTGAYQVTSPTAGTGGSVGYADATLDAGINLGLALGLTEQGGAIVSEGLDPAALSTAMSRILGYARDWVSVSTVWAATRDEQLELAHWCASYDTRYLYVLWDADISAATPGSTASVGVEINDELELDGICCVYNTAELAAAVMGAVACLNFDQLEGRTTLAYRQFEGVRITCDNDAAYDALLAHGYNCYADFATASARLKFFQNGQVSGRFDWIDTYVNAIAIKDALQLNILDLFKAMRSLPYNEDGYGAVRTSCLDTIERFKRFGAIRAGVRLSQTQRVQLLAEIGKDVSQTLETSGWYMHIKDPGAVVRGQRGTPDCAFYYVDGGSIQRIIMPATVIQ